MHAYVCMNRTGDATLHPASSPTIATGFLPGKKSGNDRLSSLGTRVSAWRESCRVLHVDRRPQKNAVLEDVRLYGGVGVLQWEIFSPY